jgi:mannose-6-phosphate isomerase-like protein (cupin superfamily)
VSEIFVLDQLLAERDKGGRSYREFLRVPAMSGGIYILPSEGMDLQRPHEQDEIYYVISGAAKIRLRNEEKQVEKGNLIFVEAGLDHRFVDIQQELVLLVFFAPAESS